MFPHLLISRQVNCLLLLIKKKLSLQGVIKMDHQLAEEIPLEGILCTPNTILTHSSIIYYRLTILLHLLLAILIDLILKLTKYQPM